MLRSAKAHRTISDRGAAEPRLDRLAYCLIRIPTGPVEILGSINGNGPSTEPTGRSTGLRSSAFDPKNVTTHSWSRGTLSDGKKLSSSIVLSASLGRSYLTCSDLVE